MIWVYAVPAELLGFLAGVLAFRRTLVWCRVCGAGLTCADCGR